jgi:hypothetical protein
MQITAVSLWGFAVTKLNYSIVLAEQLLTFHKYHALQVPDE